MRPSPKGRRVCTGAHALLRAFARLAALAATATCTAAGAGALAPAADAVGIDGISDQSLPAWEGSFAASSLAATLGDRLTGSGPQAQIRFARYVLQWDALAEASAGPAASGDYRERFEAWLLDVHRLGLTPVLALSSYDRDRPAPAASYAVALTAVLALADALGVAIPYVEAWNEPNNQGHEPAAAAARLANAAESVCAGPRPCTVIAGDFEDDDGLPAYERAYVQGLDFRPLVWGVHPYESLRLRSDTPLRAMVAALPDAGLEAQLWFTEIAAFYCRRGRVLGEAAQAAEASYLLDRLLRDPAVASVHAFYYGVMYADGAPAPCAVDGGEDSELYAPDGTPRAAAGVVFAADAAGRSPLIGPAPGQDALTFAWMADA